MTASLVACGAVVTLLPVVWPFFYVSSPVPEPFDCLEPGEPSHFKCSGPEDPRIVNHNFDTCWVRPPFTSHPLMGHGMPGLAPRSEDDDSFTTLFVLYVLAVAVSCAGAVVSSRMMLLLRRSGTYRATNYRRYLRALVFYFLMQTLVNFCAAIAFVENRCHYHNVDLRRPHLPGVAGSPWAGRPEMEPNPAGSYVARALCTLSSFVGGITTNVVLELVLVRKARMVEGVDRLRRFLKAIAWLVVAQLLLLLVSTVGGFFSLTLPMLMEEPREDGRVFFSVFDTNGDGELTPDEYENSATYSAINLMCFGLLHAFVSAALCYVFVKLLTTAKRRDKAAALASRAAGPGGGVAGGGGAAAGGFPPVAGAAVPDAPPRAGGAHRRRATRDHLDGHRRLLDAALLRELRRRLRQLVRDARDRLDHQRRVPAVGRRDERGRRRGHGAGCGARNDEGAHHHDGPVQAVELACGGRCVGGLVCMLV